ncbi:MAG: Asp-tRNA(Asn)/Glu-tRNA(Gln) amidotransferase subunit GatC [Kiritimatiellaceae bacterium]|nr:MAG: Asp-tRNA(Asn)/Glu-tRNA(Gln) amidotransferase subunit GatC [Kiritimatiellaceae bacterium]|tara:strand:+ start:3673 stop:3969 length:297 start_codon:yes stop_codon:yes gene_type:complete
MESEKHTMDVGYVAKLAAIELTDQEKELFHSQLDQVLSYVEQLNEVNLGEVEVRNESAASHDQLRSDDEGISLSHEVIMANAPSASSGCVRVPKIIDQ